MKRFLLVLMALGMCTRVVILSQIFGFTQCMIVFTMLLCQQVDNPEELTIETVHDDIEIEREEGQGDVMAVSSSCHQSL